MTTWPAPLIVVALVLPPVLTAAAPAQDLTDHGVGTPLAERRGVVGVQDAAGHNLVIACSTDLSPRGWILVTDIDTGETEQIYAPEGVPNGPPYGSLVSRSGLFYTAMGSVLLGFDPTSRQWTFQHRFEGPSAFLRIIETPDGVIWAGDVYRAGLVSYDPATGETRDHGRMDDREEYLSHLAWDDRGWLYCGIGTAAHKIVAYNPATGERRQIVPEAELAVGTALVQTGTDGNAYGRAGTQWYRLSGGDGTKIEATEVPAKLATGDIYWGDVAASFPDGRSVTGYSMEGRNLTVLDPATGESTRINFDYASEGSAIRVLTAGPDGRIYACSAHPSRLIVYDPATGELRHHPDAIALKGFGVQGRYVFGGHYTGGKLYVLDTALPWQMHARPPRLEGGLDARSIVTRAQVEEGEAFYLDGHDVALLKGERYGSTLHVPWTVPEAGRYFALIATYTAPSYCRGQLLVDGKEVGEPFDPRGAATGPGPVLSYGPLQLDAGEHRLSLRTVNGDSENPWLSVRGIALTQRLPEEVTLAGAPPNPRLVAEFAPDINVPWGALAHPDGDHILISGNPGYGVIGGGVAIYNLRTGESLLLRHTELVENHTTMDMTALANGDVVGCTSISGGHGTTALARDAALYLLDWQTRTVRWRVTPIPGLASIVSLVTGPDGLLYCIGSNSTLFAFDPATQQVVRQEDLSAWGGVPYQPIANGPDGAIYLLLQRAILRVQPGSFAVEPVAEAPGSIGGGIGILGKRLYFAVGSHLWSVGL